MEKGSNLVNLTHNDIKSPEINQVINFHLWIDSYSKEKLVVYQLIMASLIWIDFVWRQMNKQCAQIHSEKRNLVYLY